MPDNSIECVLGRLQATVDALHYDLQELKTEHKDIHKFISEQKSFYKFFWLLVSTVSGLIYFSKDVYEFMVKIKGH